MTGCYRLLGFVAWPPGDGALANVVLDRALADAPSYSMALLLHQVIAAGVPLSLARLPMTPGEVAASYDGAEGHEEDPATIWTIITRIWMMTEITRTGPAWREHDGGTRSVARIRSKTL